MMSPLWLCFFSTLQQYRPTNVLQTVSYIIIFLLVSLPTQSLQIHNLTLFSSTNNGVLLCMSRNIHLRTRLSAVQHRQGVVVMGQQPRLFQTAHEPNETLLLLGGIQQSCKALLEIFSFFLRYFYEVAVLRSGYDGFVDFILVPLPIPQLIPHQNIM